MSTPGSLGRATPTTTAPLNLTNLACIGGALWQSARSVGGQTGSSDTYANGVVNIFDVVLHTNNYPFTVPLAVVVTG